MGSGLKHTAVDGDQWKSACLASTKPWATSQHQGGEEMVRLGGLCQGSCSAAVRFTINTDSKDSK